MHITQGTSVVNGPRCLLILSKCHVCAPFPWCTHKPTKKNGSGMSVLLIWLFCFVVDPVAWVCIHGQFLQALPVKPGMRVSSPKPICGIVHSVWLSLTHTASCLRGSHEPVLPPRKEMFVTHGPVSHDYTVQTQKGKSDWKKKIICNWSFVLSPWISLSPQQGITVIPYLFT